MAISGSWTLHYSWGCTGSYANTPIVFNPDGTFTGPGTGQWRQRMGTVSLSFDTGPAKYGGTVNGNIGSGIMSTFAGSDGCWYLSQAGTTGLQSALPQAQESAQPAGPDGTPRQGVVGAAG